MLDATAAFLAATASSGDKWSPVGSAMMSSIHWAKVNSVEVGAEGAAATEVDRARRAGRRKDE
jgi:hypothetical protein